MLGLTAYLTGPAVRRPPGIPISLVFVIGLVVRRRPRARQRRARRVRQGAGAGDHPRHALHLPRDLPRVGRQRPDQRLATCRDDFLRLGTRQMLDHPGPDDRRARRARRRRLLHAHLARRPRDVRDRVGPGRRRALRPARHPRVVCGVRRSAARWRGSPASFYAARYGTVSSGAGRGIELEAVGRRGHRRRRDLRRQRHRRGARRIGAFLLVTIDRALPILGIPDFWQRAVVGALIIGAIVLDRVLARRRNAGSSRPGRDDRSVMSTPTRPPSTSAPTPPTHGRRCWRRVLLTREIAVIALLAAGRRLRDAQRAELRRPADARLPVARHRADPAHRAADDAGDHHRRDRPVGREHRRPDQRAARRAAPGRPADRGRRAARSWSARLCGAFNGFLVAYVGLPSLAVTIGTLALYRGLAVGLLGTTAITDFPERWTDLAKDRIGESRRTR